MKTSDPTTPEVQTQGVAPGIVRAREVFLEQFPALYADRKTRDKYVCIYEDKVVLVNKDYFALLREFYARDIPENASLVVKVTKGSEEDERMFAEEAEFTRP